MAELRHHEPSSTEQKASERYPANVGGVWTEKRTETCAYDSVGRLATITHADGTSIHDAYDGADDLASAHDERHASPNTTYSYDSAKRLTAVTQSLATAPDGHVVTSHGYDALDHLSSVTDPNGNVTQYLVDDFEQIVRQTSPVTGMTSYVYDAAGNLLTSTDANGATTGRTTGRTA